jgi:hypothetical protein
MYAQSNSSAAFASFACAKSASNVRVVSASDFYGSGKSAWLDDNVIPEIPPNGCGPIGDSPSSHFRSAETHVGLHTKYSLFLSDFNQNCYRF